MGPDRAARRKFLNKRRRQARQLVHKWILVEVLLAAQGFTCPICKQSLTAKDDFNVEHVHPVAETEQNAGNILLAHTACNEKKRDEWPDDFAVEMLDIVNEILGYDPELETGYVHAHKQAGYRLNIVEPPDVADFPLLLYLLVRDWLNSKFA